MSLKRLPLGKSDLLRQVTSYERLNSYFKFSMTVQEKGEHFIQVTA